MAFTMHSHSGEFCPSHAKDQLEDIIQHAIKLGLKTVGLTEHMPRTRADDLFPDEMIDSARTLAEFGPRHDAYVAEARRLRVKYRDQLHILLGFEGEWIRREDYEPLIKLLMLGGSSSISSNSSPLSSQQGMKTTTAGGGEQLLQSQLELDYFVGSVHHVHNIAIGCDPPCYAAALAKSVEKAAALEKGTAPPPSSLLTVAGRDVENERLLFADYYDTQYDLLTTLQPRIVGHFDLIRLFSSSPFRNPSHSPSSSSSPTPHPADPAPSIEAIWPEAWQRITRNLAYVVSYGGWLECNTSALRKGLAEPYPSREIARTYLVMGGRFTVSDDSHGIDQLATHYRQGIAFLSLGVASVWTLQRVDAPDWNKGLREVEVPLDEFEAGLVTEK